MTTTIDDSYALPIGDEKPHFYRMAKLEQTIERNRRTAIEQSGTGTNFAARNDYRTRLATLDNTNPVPRVADLLQTWLEEKKISVSLDHDNYFDTASQSFDIIYSSSKGEESFRARLVDRNPGGLWKTDIYASSDGWIYISVINDRARNVKVPRIAKSLLKELELGDAGVRLHSHVEIVTHRTVRELLELIESPHRRIPLFVAGSHITESNDLDKFTDMVGSWTAGIQGLGKVVALDKSATDYLDEHLGKFAPFRGTLRTYLPKVDTALPSDAIRHRYLTWRNLQESDGRYASRIVRSIAREQAVDRLVDSELRRFRRTFSSLENIHRIEERRNHPTGAVHIDYEYSAPDQTSEFSPVAPISTSEPKAPQNERAPKTPRIFDKKRHAPEAQARPTSPESDASTATERTDLEESRGAGLSAAFAKFKARTARTLQQVAGLVGLSNFTMDAFKERVEEMRVAQSEVTAYEDIFTEQDEEITNLQQANHDYDILLQLLEDDVNALEISNASLNNEIARLRDRLKANEQYGDLYPTKGHEVEQRSASEILKHLPRGVVFTGSFKDVEEFEATDTNQSGTLNLSQTVRSMREYLYAKRDRSYTDTFHGFVVNTPKDRNCYIAPEKSVPTESKITMQQFGKDRTFKVPTGVSPSGEIEMRAHIRLMRGRSGHGRLHYYYDSTSNRIFIGYVGAHLRNTLTN